MFVRRTWAMILAVMLCLGGAVAAHAETEYPPRPQGAVADLAGVLGEQTIQDLDQLSQRLEDTSGGHLYVLTRHFLGGMNAQAYANKVFSVWGLEEQDALFLIVVGEENYALALGSLARQAVPADTQTSLQANHFRTAFLNRQYDEAMADLAVSLCQSLAKAWGDQLNVSGLFGQAAIQSTPQPQSIGDLWSGMFAREDYAAREDDDDFLWQNWQDEWQYEERHINWRGIIIWGLVIYFLFFRKKKKYNFGHAPGKRR